MKLMLNCRDHVRLVLAAEDRRLTLAERWASKLHLAICRNCPEFGRQIALTRQALDRWNPYRDRPREGPPAP